MSGAADTAHGQRFKISTIKAIPGALIANFGNRMGCLGRSTIVSLLIFRIHPDEMAYRTLQQQLDMRWRFSKAIEACGIHRPRLTIYSEHMKKVKLVHEIMDAKLLCWPRFARKVSNS